MSAPLAQRTPGPRRQPNYFEALDALGPDTGKGVWQRPMHASIPLIYAAVEAKRGPDHFRKTIAVDATPDAIKQRLWECGTSLARVAAEAGVDRRALGRAIAPVDDDALRQLVADAVGLQLHQIWPSLYRPDGTRKSSRRALSKAERAAA